MNSWDCETIESNKSAVRETTMIDSLPSQNYLKIIVNLGSRIVSASNVWNKNLFEVTKSELTHDGSMKLKSKKKTLFSRPDWPSASLKLAKIARAVFEQKWPRKTHFRVYIRLPCHITAREVRFIPHLCEILIMNTKHGLDLPARNAYWYDFFSVLWSNTMCDCKSVRLPFLSALITKLRNEYMTWRRVAWVQLHKRFDSYRSIMRWSSSRGHFKVSQPGPALQAATDSLVDSDHHIALPEVPQKFFYLS